VAERLRIALITERFGQKFGGAEAYAVHLFQQLSPHHDVTVIAREFAHDLPIKEIHVKKCQGWPSWIRALHFAYWSHRLTKNQSLYDVVHTHAMGPSGDIHVVHVVPVKFRRFHLQSRWRGLLSCLQPRTLAYLWLEAASVRAESGRQVVAVSPSVQEQLCTAYSKLEHVEMIPPGAQPVAVNLDTRIRMRSLFRSQLGWTLTDIGCLLVARNPLRKGLAAVLQALVQLPAHYKLAVVGADAQARHYLQRNHPELLERVTLLDPVSDVSPYYECADIYVHPTLRDSFGMAPLEAMSHGLPVVLSAAQYCGFAAFVQHQHDAWVLDDPHNASAIAAALLALDPHRPLGMQIVERSADLVQAFSWEVVAKRYEALYFSVVRGRNAI
jgi:glycosyltransferase involved in cell wall biosynthesis